MIIAFKFRTPTDPGRFTMLTSNLILAYLEAKKTKSEKIVLWILLLFVSSFLFFGNMFEYLHFCNGYTWFVIETIMIVVCIYMIIYSIMWTGPQAVWLCAALNIEGFEEYIQEQLDKMQVAIRPENIKIMRFSYKDVKHMQKIIGTMEMLSEIYKELRHSEDLYEQIEFLRGYTGLYGFDFKDITKEVIDAQSKQK